MRKSMMSHKVVIIIAMFFLVLGIIFSILDYNITGFVVSESYDQEMYSHKVSGSVQDMLNTIYSFQKEDYLLKLQNYSDGLEFIETIVSENDINEYEVFNIVKVSARKNEIISIIKSENVEMVDSNIALYGLRDSALGYLGVKEVKESVTSNNFNDINGEGVKVAIIDSGLYLQNDEFCENVGEESCFIKRWKSTIKNDDDVDSIVETRNLTQNKFMDKETTKEFDLNKSDVVLYIELFGSEDVIDIESASMSIYNISSDTANVKVICGNEEIPVNLNHEISIEKCMNISRSTSIIRDYRPNNYLINFTLTGEGKVKVDNLDVSYSFNNTEYNGSAIDMTGHGTQVAGIFHSTAPESDVYVYKIINESNEGNLESLIAAMESAIYDEVDIMSMSFGFNEEGKDCYHQDFQLLKSIIDDANKYGIKIIAAAGNDNDKEISVPACFENTIAIGSIDEEGNPLNFSHGEEMDFVMPGKDIVSTSMNGVNMGSGTSFSTPFASGIIAMMQEKLVQDLGVSWNYNDMFKFLKNYSTNLTTEEHSNETGYGTLKYNKLVSSYNTNGLWMFSRNEITLSLDNLQDSIQLFTSKNDLDIEFSWDNSSTKNNENISILIDEKSSNFTINSLENSEIVTFSIDKNYTERITHNEVIDIVVSGSDGETEKIIVNVIAGNNSIDTDYELFFIPEYLDVDYEEDIEETLSNLSKGFYHLDNAMAWLQIDKLFNATEFFLKIYNETGLYILLSASDWNKLDETEIGENLEYDHYILADKYSYTQFNRTGNYSYELIATVDGINKTLGDGSFEILNNYSIDLYNEYFMLGENFGLDLTGNYSDGTELSSFVYLYGSSLNLSIDNITYLENFSHVFGDYSTYYVPIIEEGLHNVSINLSYLGYNLNIEKEIYFIEPINYTIEVDSLDVYDEAMNVSFLFSHNENTYPNLTLKFGPTVPRTIDYFDEVYEYVGINETITKFTYEILNNVSSFTPYQLGFNFDISTPCSTCEGGIFNYSLREYVNFILHPIIESNISLDLSIDDNEIYLMENETLIISINNLENQSIIGDLYVKYQDSLGSNIIYLGNKTISENSTFDFDFSKIYSIPGNIDLEVIFNYSNYSLSKDLSFSVNENPISKQITIDGTQKEGEDITAKVNVTNNNNEDVVVVVSVDDETKLARKISGSYNKQKTISSKSSELFEFDFNITDSGIASLSGTIVVGSYNETWSKDFSVSSGDEIIIELEETYEDYELTFDDVAYFIVDNDCENVYDECNETCEDKNETCENSCDSTYDIAKESYDSCRADCDKYDDSDDRKECRDDCKDDKADAEEERDECLDECSEQCEDCNDECTDAYDECVDESVEVELYAEWELEDEDITLYAIGENDYEKIVAVDESNKYDFDDDGYYETEIYLNELIEDESYTCEDDCELAEDEGDDQCKIEQDYCRDSCDDYDCKNDCRDDYDECKEIVDENLEDCMDDCEIVYGSYEIKIRRIELEEVEGYIFDNDNNQNNNNDVINNTDQNITQNNSIQNDTRNETQENPNEECSLRNLGKCKTAEECGLAFGKWMNGKCLTDSEYNDLVNQNNNNNNNNDVNQDNASNGNDVTNPDPNGNNDVSDPKPQPRPDPTPDIDEPSNDSSGIGGILYALLAIMTVGLLGAGGFYLYKSYNYEHQQETIQQIDNDEERKLEEYFIKQILKGHDVAFISTSLRKLGWNGILVDKVVQNLQSDENKQMSVKIAKYALDNNLTAEEIKLRFAHNGPQIVEPAIIILHKFKQAS